MVVDAVSDDRAGWQHCAALLGKPAWVACRCGQYTRQWRDPAPGHGIELHAHVPLRDKFGKAGPPPCVGHNRSDIDLNHHLVTIGVFSPQPRFPGPGDELHCRRGCRRRLAGRLIQRRRRVLAVDTLGVSCEEEPVLLLGACCGLGIIG